MKGPWKQVVVSFVVVVASGLVLIACNGESSSGGGGTAPPPPVPIPAPTPPVGQVTITQVSPDSLERGRAGALSIQGTGLDQVVSARLGGVPLPVLGQRPDRLELTVPASHRLPEAMAEAQALELLDSAGQVLARRDGAVWLGDGGHRPDDPAVSMLWAGKRAAWRLEERPVISQQAGAQPWFTAWFSRADEAPGSLVAIFWLEFAYYRADGQRVLLHRTSWSPSSRAWTQLATWGPSGWFTQVVASGDGSVPCELLTLPDGSTRAAVVLRPERHAAQTDTPIGHGWSEFWPRLRIPTDAVALEISAEVWANGDGVIHLGLDTWPAPDAATNNREVAFGDAFSAASHLAGPRTIRVLVPVSVR